MVCSLLQTLNFRCSVTPLFSDVPKRDATQLQKNGFCKSGQTVRAWLSLFRICKKGIATLQPFAHFYKPHIFAAAWYPLFHTLKKGLQCPLCLMSEKDIATLVRFAHFCKSGQTAAAWRSLFQPCIKGVTTLQPFGYYCKPHFFAAAWRPFLGQRKKGVSRCSEN